MQLFSEYVQWQNFAATEFALAEVAEERAEANVRRIEAEGFVLADPKSKVTDTRAAINTTKEMTEARDRLLDAYATRKLTEVMRGNCERTAALLSRELSRRIGGADAQRRQMRWQP
jgi:carbamoylphosphate synthase small subunit